MSSLLDLPDHILWTIITLVKNYQKLGPLRLVCRCFDHFTSELMFETIAVYGSSGTGHEPLKWLDARGGLKTSREECTRLLHLLNSLYTKRTAVALRRAKHLKIFVSDLFRLTSPKMVYTMRHAPWQAEVQNVVQRLIFTLPSIIRSLGRLDDVVFYISSYEPDDFLRNISRALLALTRLHSIDIKFLDYNATRLLPIISCERLKAVKVSWPHCEPDLVPSLGQSLIYPNVMGNELRRLELCAERRLPFGSRRCQLKALPQLEELLLENVPFVLNAEVFKEMPRLRSLRLGGFDCYDCDPYDGVWTNLRKMGTKLAVIGIDVVGRALVDYLESYTGLQALVVKLGKDANDFCVKELFHRSLRSHEKSVKLLHINLHIKTDMCITWFYEYWKEWVPAFSNLRILKLTTCLNIGCSEFDTAMFIDQVINLVESIPTLHKLTVRHIHEENPAIAEGGFGMALTGRHPMVTKKTLARVPSCLLALQNFETLYQVELDREGSGMRVIPWRR